MDFCPPTSVNVCACVCCCWVLATVLKRPVSEIHPTFDFFMAPKEVVLAVAACAQDFVLRHPAEFWWSTIAAGTNVASNAPFRSGFCRVHMVCPASPFKLKFWTSFLMLFGVCDTPTETLDFENCLARNARWDVVSPVARNSEWQFSFPIICARMF